MCSLSSNINHAIPNAGIRWNLEVWEKYVRRVFNNFQILYNENNKQPVDDRDCYGSIITYHYWSPTSCLLISLHTIWRLWNFLYLSLPNLEVPTHPHILESIIIIGGQLAYPILKVSNIRFGVISFVYKWSKIAPLVASITQSWIPLLRTSLHCPLHLHVGVLRHSCVSHPVTFELDPRGSTSCYRSLHSFLLEEHDISKSLIVGEFLAWLYYPTSYR